MVCIYCHSETKVVNSRPQKRLNQVWRRRRCQQCNTTFTSTEVVDWSGSIRVKDQKHLQPFRRDKLFLSVYNSLKHRKTAQDDATALADTVLSKLQAFIQDATLEKVIIITVTTEVLKRFDKAAAVSYSAYHT